MKKIIAVVMILLAVLSLVACNPQSEKPVEETKVAEPVVFVAPYRVDFDSIAPNVDVAAATKTVIRNMHDALYRYNSKTLEPELSVAESVTFSDDHRTVTFKLKKGVKFHNGEEMKASDVVYSYLRVAGLLPEQTEVFSSTWQRLLNPADEKGAGGIAALDDYTVEFVFAESYADSYFSNITHQFADIFILPASVSEAVQEKTPVGCGPYKFVEYLVSDSITFERFEDYHGSKPQVEKAIFRLYSDDNAQFLAFKNNEINILALSKTNYDEVKALPGVEIVEGASQDVLQVWLNQREGRLFSNKTLRQAANYAVDKQRVMDIANGGRGQLLDTHLSPANPAYNSNIKNKITVDKEKAKQLLAEAGYPNGLKTTLAVVAENQLSVDIATVLKEEFAGAGIDVELRVMPWSQYFTDVYRGFDYEMAVLQIVSYPDAYRMLSRFTTTSSNVAGATNTYYDEVIKKAAAQVDVAEQYRYYQEAQQILVDDATNIFLFDQGVQMALNQGFSNYVNYPFAFTDVASIVKK